MRILDTRCVGKTFPDYFETLFTVARTDTAAVPVITVDGPTASGKGTLASAVAQALGYHFLDSGALYRATALAAMQAGVSEHDEAGLAAVAAGIASFNSDGTSSSVRVWDPAHGHYHNAQGVAVP